MEIETLGNNKTEIETLFADASLSGDKINELSLKLREINIKIEQKEERWFELLSKLEG